LVFLPSLDDLVLVASVLAPAVAVQVLNSPSVWCPHGDTGYLEVCACGFSAHTGGLLDAPKRPAEPAQCYNLLFFSSLKTLLMATEPIWRLVAVNVSGVVIVGRF
jgi:hypothetical protein